MMLTENQILKFRREVWDYFYSHRRHMPWRDEPSPYHVLVSEMMLQQTQVSRVLVKYPAFVNRFPTVRSLAQASLAEVLAAWNGLGYNRRAKSLHDAAKIIMHQHDAAIPDDYDQLIRLPGIGSNTAGAILAYAFGRPVVFVETNIRTVMFHHFFGDAVGIDDQQLRPILQQVLDQQQPREWYWALMDYGAHLKQTVGKNIAQSRHYAKQSKFEGSRRQIRGWVLRTLLDGPRSLDQLASLQPDQRLAAVVDDLRREGFVAVQSGEVRLTASSELP